MTLDFLRSELFRAMGILNQYEAPLRRYFQERSDLRNRIIQTYPHQQFGGDEDDDGNWRPVRYVVERWAKDDSGRRAKLLEELDALNRRWSPEMQKRKTLKAIVKALRFEVMQAEKKELKK